MSTLMYGILFLYMIVSAIIDTIFNTHFSPSSEIIFLALIYAELLSINKERDTYAEKETKHSVGIPKMDNIPPMPPKKKST